MGPTISLRLGFLSVPPGWRAGKDRKQKGGSHRFGPSRAPIQRRELALWLPHDSLLVHSLPFHELVFLEAHHLALGHWQKQEKQCFLLINGIGKTEVNYPAAA